MRKRALVLRCVATWLINTWICGACIAGCAGSAAQRTEALARNGGASIARVDGAGFEHVVFARNLRTDDSALHIYFSGDGSPFVRPTQIATDPTPHDPIEVRLMLEDPTASIFIGRPCYQGLAAAPGCNATLWSVARYSETVVASMTAAVRGVVDASRASRITLIGYSGGGVLALLVVQRIARIDTVVTIAANLDIEAWAQLHGYSALSQSLNPASITQWRESLHQIHLVGAFDRNVPPVIAEAFARNQAGIEVRVLPEFDHRCCWVDAWPALLQTF